MFVLDVNGRRCLNIRGMHNCAPRHLTAGLNFFASNRHLPFQDLVTDWQSLSSAPRIMNDALLNGKLRLGIRP